MNLLNLCLFFLFLNYGTSREVNSRRGKIAGGYEARAHSNPYVVSLQTRFLWWRTRLCTGSILSQRWILTAGHCITDSWARWFSMDAIVGAHSLEEVSQSQIYQISHRIAHPLYRGDVGPYDIGMTKTYRNIKYSSKVQPIRLPTDNAEPKGNEKLLMTGWGALSSNAFLIVIPNKLQEVEVTYLPYYDCSRAVDMILDKYEPNPLKRKANICTGPISGGIAGCSGDSGGPLVQYIKREDTMTSVALSSSPIPMTTDRTTRGSTSSPIPMPTNRPSSTTAGSTSSPIPMPTDRPSSTTTGSTSSPIPMPTDRPFSSTTGSTSSPIPMPTDRPSTSTTGSTSSPIPMPTDRPFSTTTGSTSSPIPISTDRSSTTSEVTSSSSSMISTDINIDIPDMNSLATTMRNSMYNPSTSSTGVMSSTTNSTSKPYSIKYLKTDMIPTVIGVMSWGIVPCGEKGAPTVYSNVSNYMDFINKYLNSS